MPERGATPTISGVRRRALGLASHFTSPLRPDDYLELINPLWSTRELRGRVLAVERECDVAVTITIKPGWEWPGHRAGQYVRLGVQVGGVHHWRAYSLTSDPQRRDGCIAITPKLVEGGAVSPHLCQNLKRGEIVRLGGVEGSFTLPDPLPEKLLFLSAGSGITPVMSMLRSLDRSGQLRDVVHIHCARRAEEAIFRAQLHELDARENGYRLHERLTAREGRLQPDELERDCRDWRERETLMCGPSGMIATFRSHWREHGEPKRLRFERFAPDLEMDVGDLAPGMGGEIELTRSGIRASNDGTEPILLTGESAGAKLPHGCRMGICNSCVGTLRSGKVRDLRTGRVHGQPGELVRTCVNAPEGPVSIEL